MSQAKPPSPNYAYHVTVAIVGTVVGVALVTGAAVGGGNLVPAHQAVALVAGAAGILVGEWQVQALPPSGRIGISQATVFILISQNLWGSATTWLVTVLILAVLALSLRAPGDDDPWRLVALKWAFNGGSYAIALVGAAFAGHLVRLVAGPQWALVAEPAGQAAGTLVFSASTWLLCSVVNAQGVARPLGEQVRETWRLEAVSAGITAVATPVALVGMHHNLTLGSLIAAGLALVSWITTRSRLAAPTVDDPGRPTADPPAVSAVAGVVGDPAPPAAAAATATGGVADPAADDVVTRSILLADIEGYSTRSDAVEARLRAQLRSMLETAITAAGIHAGQCETRDEGDLYRAVFSPDVPKNRLLHPLVTDLERHLDAYNATAPPREQMRLRVVVDQVDVRHDGSDYFGHALNDAYGILHAPQARTRLAKTPGSLILLVSRELYEAVVPGEAPGIDPAAFEPVAVTLKTGLLQVWACPPVPDGEPPSGAAPTD